MTDQRRTVAPYGTWTSPITPEILTKSSISFGEIAVVNSASSSHLVYVENRPEEKGRAALVSRDLRSKDRQTTGFDLTRGRYNTRSAVHEYGGGALAAGPEDSGVVVFSSYKPNDHAVYRCCLSQGTPTEPERITAEQPALRYADFSVNPVNPNLILAIQEDHTIDKPDAVINTLVLIEAEKKSVRVLAEGQDFYASPRWSPDGKHVAWVSWNHPEMPFWATELWVAAFDYEKMALSAISPVSGQEGGAITAQPVWLRGSSSNCLLFTSDAQNGFSLPYKVNIQGDCITGLHLGSTEPLLKAPVEADFIKPPWTLNNSSMAALSDAVVVCALTRGSTKSLGLLWPSTGKFVELQSSFKSFSQLRRVSDSQVVANVANAASPAAIVIIELAAAIEGQSATISPEAVRLVKRSSDLLESGQITKSYLSQPRDFTFPTLLPPNGEPALAHGIIFAPRNPLFSAPKGSAPPCIFKIHGGPTSAASSGQLDWETNFWTSRGYSVCFVNYGGSTGYGRKYTLRLNDKWGLVDVQDCVSAAKFLSDSKSTKKGNETPAQMTKTAREQWKNLEEVYDPSNGYVTVSMRRPESSWTWRDLLTMPLFVAASALLVDKCMATFELPSRLGLNAKLAFGLASVLGAGSYLQFVKRAVLSETVYASSTLGLGLMSTTGVMLPWRKQSAIWKRTQKRWIPRDRLLDLVHNTAVSGWTVQDYLAVGVRSAPSDHRDALTLGDKATTRSLEILFPHLRPRLPIIERIHRAIYPALFPSSSNPLANAKSPVPELRGVTTGSLAHSPEPPLADSKKLIISGGSAGGYTVLACLTDHPDVFSAGTSKYGVADLKLLAAESHKFESRYPLKLLSGTPEEVPDVYRDRSPIFKADKIRTPLLVAQGSEDKVVPPNQSEMIVQAIQRQPGGEKRVKYLLFESEGHGFRQKENIIRMLNEEEKWYRQVLKLDA